MPSSNSAPGGGGLDPAPDAQSLSRGDRRGGDDGDGRDNADELRAFPLLHLRRLLVRLLVRLLLVYMLVAAAFAAAFTFAVWQCALGHGCPWDSDND